MARRVFAGAEAIGSDSFTDVVTNIVGILIILILLVGIRVRNAPVAVGAAVAPAIDETLVALEAERAAVELDILGQEQLLGASASQIAAARWERDALALAAVQAERELSDRQAKLAVKDQEGLRLRQSADAARELLAQLAAERQSAEAELPPPIELRTNGTPISHTVHGKEAHFELQAGRLTATPLGELTQSMLTTDKDRLRDRLSSTQQMTETIGPLDGWRLRYTLDRIDVAVGWIARLREFVLIPPPGVRGESIDESLATGSAFRRELRRHDPHGTTITLWTYPESFAECQRVKTELYRLGYAVACRPLPAGQPIGGSPQGSRSAAE